MAYSDDTKSSASSRVAGIGPRAHTFDLLDTSVTLLLLYHAVRSCSVPSSLNVRAAGRRTATRRMKCCSVFLPSGCACSRVSSAVYEKDGVEASDWLICRRRPSAFALASSGVRGLGAHARAAAAAAAMPNH